MNKVLTIVLLILLLNLASCSPAGKSSGDAASGDKRKVLTMYVMESQYKLIHQKPMFNFNSRNKKVKIEPELFYDINEYRNKLTTGLLTGEGPDIVCFDSNAFNSIHAAVSNNVFADLNELIKDNPDFNTGQYNEKVLDAGVFAGKRCFIPILYYFNYFLTTRETLERNNISIDESNWSLQALTDTVRKFAREHEGENRYFFNELYFIDIINSCGISFINYEDKTAHFDSPQFIDILRMYKEMTSSIRTYAGGYSGDVIRDDKIIIKKSAMQISPLTDLFSDNSSIELHLGEETQIYPFPTYSGEKGVYAVPRDMVGISGNCRYKQDAFEYIKHLVSKDTQTSFSGLGIPVNNDAYRYFADEFVNYNKNTSKMGFYTEKVPLPAKLSERFDMLVDSIRQCEMPEKAIDRIITEEVKSFLDGEKTAEQAAQAINYKVGIFLNE